MSSTRLAFDGELKRRSSRVKGNSVAENRIAQSKESRIAAFWNIDSPEPRLALF